MDEKGFSIKEPTPDRTRVPTHQLGDFELSKALLFGFKANMTIRVVAGEYCNANAC